MKLITLLLILLCIGLIIFLVTFIVKTIRIRKFFNKIEAIQDVYDSFQHYSDIANEQGNDSLLIISINGEEDATVKVIEFLEALCNGIINAVDDFYEYCDLYDNLFSCVNAYEEKTKTIKTIRRELSIWKLENAEHA